MILRIQVRGRTRLMAPIITVRYVVTIPTLMDLIETLGTSIVQ